MGRRQELADLIKLEDFGRPSLFLHPRPPLRFLDLIPENTIHISSLSKPFNSRIKTAYAVLPVGLVNEVIGEVRLTSSGNSALLASFATHIMESDALEQVIVKKRLQGNGIAAKSDAAF